MDSIAQISGHVCQVSLSQDSISPISVSERVEVINSSITTSDNSASPSVLKMRRYLPVGFSRQGDQVSVHLYSSLTQQNGAAIQLGQSASFHLGRETVDVDYVSDSDSSALVVYHSQAQGLHYLSYIFNRSIRGSIQRVGLDLPFSKVSVISISENTFIVLGITQQDRNAYLYRVGYNPDTRLIRSELITVEKAVSVGDLYLQR